MTQPAQLSATGRKLVQTAEALFAAHGIAGVSLRQISADSGSANSSSVHYHFGTKEALVEAIFAFRLPELLQRRALLKARCDPEDLRSRLEGHLLPLFEWAESLDSFYVSFVEQVQRGPDGTRLFAAQPEIARCQDEFRADVSRLLPKIPLSIRTMRIDTVQSLALQAAALRERNIALGTAVIPFGLSVSTLIDGFTGFLTGPVSPETRRFLSRSQLPADRLGISLI